MSTATDTCFDTPLAERLVLGTISTDERERLLAHSDGCDACLDILAEATRRLVSAGEGDTPATPLTHLLPDETPPGGVFAGRYVVLDTLGRGGMGVVHLAHDTLLGREVALKVVRHASSRTVDKLREEAQALAAVVHPNVVTVFDLLVDGERLAIAMERVRGPTLRQHIAHTRPRRRRLVAALVELSAGIRAAHEAGVVHGDVKLDNALVDQRGRVRVTDFGLGHVVGRPLGLTGGTSDFLAPEVATTAEPTPASDQYALATAWLDALTGQRGHDAASWQALAREATPRWARAPLARALSERREQRFPNVAAFVGALKRSRRHALGLRLLIALLVFVTPLLLLVHQRQRALGACVDAALAGLPAELSDLEPTTHCDTERRLLRDAERDYRAWFARLGDQHARICAAPAEHAELAACLAVERRWVQEEHAYVHSRPAHAYDTRHLDALGNISAFARESWCDDPYERAAINRALMDTRSIGELDDALTAIFRRGGSASPDELDPIVSAFSVTGDDPSLRASTATSPGAESYRPSRLLIVALLFRSASHEQRREIAAAQADAELAFLLATRMRRSDLTARAAVVLGSIAIQEHADLRGARVWARLARSLGRELTLPGYRRMISELEATVAVASGRAHEVVTSVDDLLADPLAAPFVGPRLLALRGAALVELGAFDLAQRDLDEALAQRLGSDPTDPSRIAGALHNQAQLAWARGDGHRATSLLDDAIRLRAYLPADHPDRLALARTEARLSSELFGRHEEALALAEDVLAATRRGMPDHHVDVVAALGLAAECALRASAPTHAYALAREAELASERHDLGGGVAALPALVLADLGHDPRRQLDAALAHLGHLEPTAPLCSRLVSLARALGVSAGPCEPHPARRQP